MKFIYIGLAIIILIAGIFFWQNNVIVTETTFSDDINTEIEPSVAPDEEALTELEDLEVESSLLDQQIDELEALTF